MTESDTAVARVLLLAIAVSVVFAVLLAAAARRRPRRAAAGHRPVRRPGVRRRGSGPPRAARRRRVQPARREPQPPRPRPAAAATASCARSWSRSRPRACYERPDAVVRRAADQARGRVRDDRLRAAARRPARDPHRGGRPRRSGPRSAPTSSPPGSSSASSSATSRRRATGSGRTRTCSSCSRSRSSAAIRNAQLYARVEDQNRRLVDLDEAKDDFLRGVSHNLQTPLASIRGYAQQLAMDSPDRRLGIITEQADRLSRMVRQLLTVSRIESGALRPRRRGRRPRPRACGGRGRRWASRTCRSRSTTARPAGSPSPTATSWTRCCGRSSTTPSSTAAGPAIDVTITVDAEAGDLGVTIADHGGGVAEEDRERLFQRFARGSARPADEGSGLGL